LYNLHAQSLKDIQDRLELVFGMPAASMYSTDRYSFLKKVRFGRKSRVYRMLGFQYETDIEHHQYVQTFDLKRGNDIEHTGLSCLFCELPEASSPALYNVDLGAISKKLKLKFTPPALQRRSDETGLPVKDYVMEAFYKGKLYDLMYHASIDNDEPALIELDFVLKCLNSSNRILKEHSGQEPDWGAYDKLMVGEFNKILAAELSEREETAQTTGQAKKERKTPQPVPAAPKQPSKSHPTSSAPSSPSAAAPLSPPPASPSGRAFPVRAPARRLPKSKPKAVQPDEVLEAEKTEEQNSTQAQGEEQAGGESGAEPAAEQTGEESQN
jgi:hypothetical protein